MTETPSAHSAAGREGAVSATSLVRRATDMLLRPRTTWAVIDGERATTAGLFIPYVLALAVIGPVASFLGGQIFGYGAFGISYRPALVPAAVSALLSYGLTLVAVFVLALAINALATSFGATKNHIQSLKTAVYAATAGWLAGIFGIVPSLAILGLLGLYSCYLLYLGLKQVMKAPDDKAIGYTVVVILVAAVIFFTAGVLTASLTATGAGLGRVSGPSLTIGGNADGGSVTLPGGSSIDAGRAAEMAEALEQGGLAEIMGGAAEAIAGLGEGGGEGSGATVVPGTALQALLPATIAGLPRVSMESGSVVMGSIASGTYEQGDARITLSLSDLGRVGAMAMAMAPETRRESNGRYERTGRINGRFTTESYDEGSRGGAFGIMIGNRVMVQAEGTNVGMDALQASVAAIDARQIERLVRR